MLTDSCYYNGFVTVQNRLAGGAGVVVYDLHWRNGDEHQIGSHVATCGLRWDAANDPGALAAKEVHRSQISNITIAPHYLPTISKSNEAGVK